jgi:hypothetical protein
MRSTESIIIATLLILTLAATITAQPNPTGTTKTSSTTIPSSGTITYDSSIIMFSGYAWKIRNSPDTTSTPGPNLWSNSTLNVWVDGNGWLHLKITYHNGKWYCPEVSTLQALGYGTYVFHTASPVDSLDKNVVLGLFTYKDDSHEVDIEYSRQGQEGGFNSGFTVQPAPYTPDNALDFYTHLIGTESTHLFTWRSNKVDFETIQGNYNATNAPAENIIKAWQSRVSCDASEAKTVLNLWLYHGLAPSDLHEVEAVVTSFEFSPL